MKLMLQLLYFKDEKPKAWRLLDNISKVSELANSRAGTGSPDSLLSRYLWSWRQPVCLPAKCVSKHLLCLPALLFLFFPVLSSLLEMLGGWGGKVHPAGLSCSRCLLEPPLPSSPTHPPTLFGYFLKCLDFLCYDTSWKKKKSNLFNVSHFGLSDKTWTVFPRAMGHP